MANPEKVVITAALPYANGPIHIGHLLEYLQADIYSRFLKSQGKNVLYICASDMHGTPIEVNAKKAGERPETFVEKFWKEHQQDFASFLINFDNYYKTHSQENKELAELFFDTLKKKKLIYTQKIKIIYCEKCRRSLPDRYVQGECPHCHEKEQYGDICEKCGQTLKGIDLINPHCSLCHSKPVQKDSQHYFFKLSSFSDALRKWFNSKEAGIQPEIKNWLKNWLNKGLEDWCISRDEPYFGFEIPDSKKETGGKKYFYVWLDAPIGYISSTKNYCDKNKCSWEDYWKKGIVYHFIGKDITYFHFLFWPAILTAMNIPLPRLTVHGFITVDGQKMSKSRGTFFTAKDFLKSFPAEALRFYYASHLDRKLVDIDLNFKDFQAVINNVLVGNLGNFCYRTLTFAGKNYQNINQLPAEAKLEQGINSLIRKIEDNYSKQDFKSAVKNILKIADQGNIYFQNAEPWKNKEKKEKEAGFCVNLARNLSILAQPILPQFSEKIQASLSEKNLSWKDLGFRWKGKVEKLPFLVEKIENIPEKTAEASGLAGKIFPAQMKVGKIIDVKDHPQAEKLYVMTVDFGAEKRQVVAGLKNYFKPEQLNGKVAVFCTNLKPAKLRGEMSEAMFLLADDGRKLAFLDPGKAKLGEEIQFKGLKHYSKQITFNEFLKVKMVVKNGKVACDGRELAGVKVKNVKDGAKIG